MRQFNNEEMKKIRFILGMSQLEFAHVVGVSQQLVSKIEDGHRRVTEKVNSKIHEIVFLYIDKETLFKILDGEIEI